MGCKDDFFYLMIFPIAFCEFFVSYFYAVLLGKFFQAFFLFIRHAGNEAS